MKKLLLTVIAGLILGSFAFAEVSDIDVTETARPIATVWRISDFHIYAFAQDIQVTYKKMYLDGAELKHTGEKDVTINFDNVADDPMTPEDEFSSDFTDLINYIQTRIGAGDTLKQSITKAVKIKLGI